MVMSPQGGDRVYTTDGKRKYIGLHNELFDRPWTAKRQRSPQKIRQLQPRMITPHGESLLGDIDIMAREFRRICGHQDALARFSDNDVDQSDDKLQIAKQKVWENKELAAKTLRSCLSTLISLTESTNDWRNKVLSLTMARADWWEGANIFSPDEVVHE